MGRVQWNYVKFLVDRNGHPVKRFPSLYDPAGFEDDVRVPSPCMHASIAYLWPYNMAAHCTAPVAELKC